VPQEVNIKVNYYPSPNSTDLEYESSPDGQTKCYKTILIEDERYQKEPSTVCTSAHGTFVADTELYFELAARERKYFIQFSVYDRDYEGVSQTVERSEFLIIL
jgi:hypothetical protein